MAKQIGKWRNHLSRQGGMSTIEYIGLGAVILALIFAVYTVLAGAGGVRIGEAISDALASMAISFESAGVEPGTPGGSVTPGGSEPAEVNPGEASVGIFGFIKNAWQSISDWWTGVRNRPEENFGDNLIGVLIGFGEGVTELVGGLITLVVDVVNLVNPFDSKSAGDVLGKYVDGFKALFEGLGTDPLRTLASLVVDPKDWEEGRYGQVVGKALFEIVLLFLPGDEAGKVSKIDKLTPDELVTLLNRIDKLTPDELAAWLNKVDKLTPDELAGLIKRIDQLTPDEAAQILLKADQLTPDEVAALIKRMDQLTPDEAAKLVDVLQDLDHITPDEAQKAVEAYRTLKNQGVNGADDVFNNLVKSNKNNYQGYFQELDEAATMIENGNTVTHMGSDMFTLKNGRRIQVDMEFKTPEGLRIAQESKAGQSLYLTEGFKDQLNRIAQYADESGLDYAQIKFTGETISKPALEHAGKLGIRVYDSSGNLLNMQYLPKNIKIDTDMFGRPLVPSGSRRLIPSFSEWLHLVSVQPRIPSICRLIPLRV